jgi:transposase InsO family protein
LRDELLDGEIFHGLREAQVVIEGWRRHYNAVRPHASLGYRAPAPEVVVPALAARITGPSRSTSPTTPVIAPRPVMH